MRFTIFTFPLLSLHSGQPVATNFPAVSMEELSHKARNGSIREIGVFDRKTRKKILFDPHKMAIVFVEFKKALLNSRLSNCLRYSGKKNGRSPMYLIVNDMAKMKLD